MQPIFNAQGTRVALLIRFGDIGSTRSVELGHEIKALARRELGRDYLSAVVGEWWLAQLGRNGLLRDMLASFFTSAPFVLPILAVGLRNRRLFLVGSRPTCCPCSFRWASCAATGITLRIGRAMILAIALAIAVDDTIHFLSRLRVEPLRESDPSAAVVAALRHAGPAMVYTSVVPCSVS